MQTSNLRAVYVFLFRNNNLLPFRVTLLHLSLSTNAIFQIYYSRTKTYAATSST